MVDICVNRLEEQRRAPKRSYDNRPARDDYWSEPKRAATGSDRYDNHTSNFSDNRYISLVNDASLYLWAGKYRYGFGC